MLMESINLMIKNVKNIGYAEITIPLNNSLNCLVGGNGVGKSTIMSCIAKLVYPKSFSKFRLEDILDNSEICIKFAEYENKWIGENSLLKRIDDCDEIRLNGIYEGSLFYGTRFRDSLKIDDLVNTGKIKTSNIIPSDDYIIKQMSEIIHRDNEHYKKLKRVRNKDITSKLGLKNTPYFYEFPGGLVSQYRMSSGECLLVSLLHFIYNSIERKSLPSDKPILMIIDEIELALHPSAVSKLVDLLNSLVEKHNNLTIILSSHSPELIKKIVPDNIFMIEADDDNDKKINVINPCYPSYAIRDIYMHDGFDVLILVEDDLAKYFVEKVLTKEKMRQSKLINVLPVGGDTNVLKLQSEIYKENILGVGKKVFSILDGDVQNTIPNKYANLPKTFLPIKSVEKMLYSVFIDNTDSYLKKRINDDFFCIRSVKQIIEEKYESIKNDTKGKKLYNELKQDLTSRSISEDTFIKGLADTLLETADCTGIINAIKQMIV